MSRQARWAAAIGEHLPAPWPLPPCRKAYEDKYHFSCGITADLVAACHADFVVTSTYQVRVVRPCEGTWTELREEQCDPGLSSPMCRGSVNTNTTP